MKPVDILNIDFDTPSLKVADWCLSAASLVVFIFTFNWIWLVGAILGALFSWYRPLGKVQRYLKEHTLRKKGH